jgi:hypothetical protein
MNPLLKNQLKGQFENQIFNAINSAGTRLPNDTLRKIASRVAETVTVQTISLTDKGVNKNINEIPRNILGPYNPVNITTGNLGSTGLSNNLNNVLGTQVSAQISNLLINTLTKELRTVLPADRLGIINFNGIINQVIQSVTPSIGSGVTAAITNAAEAIFGKGFRTPQTVPNPLSLLSGVLNPLQGIANSNKAFASSIANKGLSDASKFNVNSASNKEKLAVTKKGFTDPTATYPTKEYAKGSETNKLAQGDIRGTIVQTKNDERLIGAPLPNGGSWEQPVSPFKGVYPYNKVNETESGHIIEMDDSPGAERLHVYHKSGTFVEIDATGSMVRRIKGTSYDIIDKNGKIFIQGTADVSVKGAINIFVAQDATIEVQGNTNLTVTQDINARAGGNVNLSALENLNLASANVYIEAFEKMHLKSNIILNMHVSNVLTLRSNVDTFIQSNVLYQNTTNSYHQTLENSYDKHGKSKFIQSSENIHVKSTGTYNTQSGGVMNFKSGSTYNMQSSSAMNLKAGGNINEDGSAIYLNSGTAGTASNATDSRNSRSANIADPSLAGTFNPQRFNNAPNEQGSVAPLVPTEVIIEDPVPVTLVDSYALRLEEEVQGNSAKEIAKQKDLIVLSGFSSPEEFDRKPIVLENENVSSEQGTVISASNSLKTATVLPGNYNLSTHFTVEQLSNKAVLSKDIIKTTADAKYGTIVYNLSATALNILEPALIVYPDLVVVSGYRTKQNSSPTSQHPLGRAVDIQFNGLPREDYYERARQLARVLNYDQFILEYCSYTKTPWIHISFLGPNNRKQVMTFWNNKKYGNGLYNLK